MSIKNIIFDMGNVLLDYNPNVILDKVCDNDNEKKIIFNELFQGPEWVEGDLGHINNIERYDLVKERVPQELHNKLYQCVNNWDICMIPLNGSIEFLNYVKEKGYKIYILSNASIEFYEYFPKYYNLDDFDGIVVSADIHIIKPDRSIYEFLLNKYMLNADECLFIDDREDNINAAKEIGINSVIFKENFDMIKDYYKL